MDLTVALIDHPRMNSVPITCGNVSIGPDHLTFAVLVVVCVLSYVCPSITVMVALSLTMPLTIKPFPIIVPPFIHNPANPFPFLSLGGGLRPMHLYMVK